MLIDELYDRGVKIVVSAAAAPAALYHGERLRWNFSAPPAASWKCRHSTTSRAGIVPEAPLPQPWHNSRDADGRRVQNRLQTDPRSRGDLVAPLPQFAADIDEVLRMYRAMTLRAGVRHQGGESAAHRAARHLSLVPRATKPRTSASAPPCAPEDVLAPVYREFGTQLWRGVTMAEILTVLGRR